MDKVWYLPLLLCRSTHRWVCTFWGKKEYVARMYTYAKNTSIIKPWGLVLLSRANSWEQGERQGSSYGNQELAGSEECLPEVWDLEGNAKRTVARASTWGLYKRDYTKERKLGRCVWSSQDDRNICTCVEMGKQEQDTSKPLKNHWKRMLSSGSTSPIEKLCPNKQLCKWMTMTYIP